MSFFNQLNTASIQAQGILAQMQGMAAGGTNILFPGGATAVGVFGTPQVQIVPMPGGGYRKRSFLTVTITRDQLESAPAEKTKFVRTDMTPHITYIIDSIDKDRALDYMFEVVRFGQ